MPYAGDGDVYAVGARVNPSTGTGLGPITGRYQTVREYILGIRAGRELSANF